MATQPTPPIPMTTRHVPELSWEKDFSILYCTQVYSAPVDTGYFGIVSNRVGMMIYPPALNFPPGVLQISSIFLTSDVIVRIARIMKLEKVSCILTAQTVRDLPGSVGVIASQLAAEFGRQIFVFRDAYDNLQIGEEQGGVQFSDFVCEATPHADQVKESTLPLLYCADYIRSIVASGNNTGHRPAYIQLKETKERIKEKSHSRVKKNANPKPPNSWILYLNERYKQVKKENKKLKTSQISVIIAKEWKNNEILKAEYKALATVAKQHHEALCGRYLVKPRKSSDIKKRKAKKEKTIKHLQIILSSQSTPGDDQQHRYQSSGNATTANDRSGNLDDASSLNNGGQVILGLDSEAAGYSIQADPAMDEAASAHVNFAAAFDSWDAETSSTMNGLNSDLSFATCTKDQAYVANLDSSDYAGLMNYEDDIPTGHDFNELIHPLHGQIF
ncbi:uncharacterized protein RCO7_09193 [Rhynchosporium graminicola]|uniref:HMG box domain-containing protein n=2 Tax=Rhynchosporium TaxID=38037 RepID=A0A1E1L377_9HELO|nr:uncharacterized protein RCO7_09193 [Rhynchosporium commune]